MCVTKMKDEWVTGTGVERNKGTAKSIVYNKVL